MSHTKTFVELSRYVRRLNGSSTEYDCTPYREVVQQIRAMASRLEKTSDAELRRSSLRLVARARNGEKTDRLVLEAFALATQAVRRSLGISPFDEQIIAALALHSGKCAEMQTGEGKTLAAVFAAYANALSGKGVHVLTFNDYLASRDAEWMGPVYRLLGLSVGCVQNAMSSTDRRSAYAADVTYLTAKEAGFDFLRDSLRCAQGASVLGPLHCAIVDEADSILIDEARIPLVIAGTSVESANIPEGLLFAMAELVRKLERGIDFEFDDYLRNIHLTEQGERRTEETLCCGNLYEERNFDTQARLSLALHAQHFLKIDEDYIVRNGKIELVDEFTGRVAEARRWPDGLQRAVEAKEGISCMLSGNILNSMTLQHFARLYPKLSGMTATAQTAEEELRRFYNMAVVVIPPHSKCIRVDLPDAIYASHEAKINALVRKIAFVHASGRPILVGTRTIRESEELGRNLAGLGIRCSVLNAWQDAREASIVAEAGALGAVTIATNMAGRGTDIRLGGAQGSSKQAVADLGGLFVIGTNKHESLRVDNQLRGRAGRQGDPGSTQFFVSLQDDLFVRYRLADLLPRRLIRPDATGYIDNKFVRSEIGRLQRIIEGQNTEIKLTLYRYSVLLEKQRVIAFDKRDHLLAGNNSYNLVNRLDPTVAHRLAEMCGADGAREQCRIMSLQCFDRLWAQHLAVASELREGIHLRRLGGQDPLYEFQKLIIDLFDTMLGSLDAAILAECRSIALGDRSFNSRNHVPSATWTYLINDNPFDPMLEIQLKGNVGLSAWAGLLWPLTALYFVAKRLSQKRSERV